MNHFPFDRSDEGRNMRLASIYFEEILCLLKVTADFQEGQVSFLAYDTANKMSWVGTIITSINRLTFQISIIQLLSPCCAASKQKPRISNPYRCKKNYHKIHFRWNIPKHFLSKLNAHRFCYSALSYQWFSCTLLWYVSKSEFWNFMWF